MGRNQGAAGARLDGACVDAVTESDSTSNGSTARCGCPPPRGPGRNGPARDTVTNADRRRRDLSHDCYFAQTDVHHLAVAGLGVPAESRAQELDRGALVALYNATGGTSWTRNTNWLSSVPVGEWLGVTTDADGRVTQLLLNYNQLTGSIPAALGSLTNLRSLHNNQLTGPIPAGVCISTPIHNTG